MKAVLPVLLLASCLLAGCATSSGPAAPARVRLADLTKGLTPDEVRALWGEPTETRALHPDADNSIVWVYRRQTGGVLTSGLYGS